MMANSDGIQTIHEQISARLRDDVFSGRLQPGTSLREESLARRFGISRSPIRQVLQQLTHEGVLESRRNRGVVVAIPPTREIRDLLLPCRVDIETHALRACFAGLTGSDFARWERIVAIMYDAGREKNVPLAVEQDRRFHHLIVEKAAIPSILGVWTAISAATHDFHRHIKENLPDLCANHVIHAALLDSFRTGDVETACRVLSDHILNIGSIHRFRELWTDAGRPSDVSGLFDELISAGSVLGASTGDLS